MPVSMSGTSVLSFPESGYCSARIVNAGGIRRVVLACGTVDLRKGIDGLATIIGDKYGQNPFEKGTLFLFCGKRSDRCKGLLLSLIHI